MAEHKPITTNYGRHLNDLLPEVYRERDRAPERRSRHHLTAYLDSHGALLDKLRATIDQLYADNFPDVPQSGRVCQSWIVPYLADLVGAVPASPFPDGRREEVANAVRWSKGKGTPRVVAEITQSIAQAPSQQQEGFSRVARTMRIDDPIQPASSYGEPVHPVDTALAGGSASTPLGHINPQIAARHPGQFAGTVDTELASRAVNADLGAPGSLEGRFAGVTRIWPRGDNASAHAEPAPTAWRQFARHGAPCFAGSYEDQSGRTVDCRSPNSAGTIGRYHPKRFLIYLPPPDGLIAPSPAQLPLPANSEWLADGTLPEDHAGHNVLLRRTDEHGNLKIENITAGSVELTGDVSIGPAASDIPASTGRSITFRKLRFSGELTLGRGHLMLQSCAVNRLRFDPMAGVDDAGRLLNAHSVLFDQISGAGGQATLEYCTILTSYAATAMVSASETIFPDDLDQLRLVCARYSRVSPQILALGLNKASVTNTSVHPRYRSADFSDSGAGVLLPSNPDALLQGAEDQGEIGAFHDWHFSAQRSALRRKLSEFLPLGLELVISWDERLICAPPRLNTAQT